MKVFCSKLLLLLLCLSISISVFAGCADDDSDDNDTPIASVEGKGEDKFKNTNFGGEVIKICMSDYKGPERSTVPSKYMTGTEESTSDNIMISINERNAYIEEKLKLTVTYSYIDDNWSTAYETIYNMYSSNTDVPDAITNQGMIIHRLMMSDLLVNCNTTEYTNYFDFTDGSWYTDAMSAYAFGNDVTKSDTGVYVLIGDYFIDYISNIWTMYVNENLLSSHTEWAPEDLYSRISDGDWTWDVLMSIASTVFEDHQDPEENRNGYLYAAYSYGDMKKNNFSPRSQKTHFYTIDIELMTFENGKYSFNNANINSSVHTLVDKMLALVNSKGCVYYQCGDLEDYCARIYSKNNTLFSVFHLYDLESDLMSSLQICPVVMPKLSSDDNYKSVSEETASLGGIFNSTNNFTEMSAYWQYQALKSDKTRETYYVDGLGLKYETGENTKDMLDLIYNSIVCEPTYVINRYFTAIGESDLSITQLVAKSMNNGSNQVASLWASTQSESEDLLDEAIQKYNSLHK